ncbi:restriction endonuclease subunit S [Trichocoleus sp. Lan]|uniref:restriction endonuclease subunit S n=1 Tax=Trichocoleus sp. Lan TaxID=2933927 RepID=UPI00329A5B21
MKIERHKAYKTTEIEWLNEVPEHWSLFRIKNLTKTKSGTTPQSGLSQYYDNGTHFWVRTTDLNNNKLYSSEFKVTYLAREHYNLISIPIRSILLAMYGGMGTIGKNAILQEEVTINQSVCAIFPNDKRFVSEYLWYYIQYFRPHWEIFADSARKDPNINQEAIKRLWVTLPPILEQESIAHYLDTKTTQIDRKIDLLTQKATLYSNLKQSLINETVTRGLDKSVPMKDSGIEWIGEIPEHWQTRRINSIAVQSKRKNTGLVEKNLLSLSYGKIKRRDIDTSFGLLPESFETYQIVEAGNIILRLTDLQNDQRSLRVGLAKERGIITSAYLCLEFLRNIHPNFAYYLLFVYDISKVFYWFGGGLRQSMKFDDVKIFPFILPLPSEQKVIVDYLDTKTAHIDRIIQTINTQIEKLKELRKTLINDVVTGKIKVV